MIMTTGEPMMAGGDDAQDEPFRMLPPLEIEGLGMRAVTAFEQWVDTAIAEEACGPIHDPPTDEDERVLDAAEAAYRHGYRAGFTAGHREHLLLEARTLQAIEETTAVLQRLGKCTLPGCTSCDDRRKEAIEKLQEILGERG